MSDVKALHGLNCPRCGGTVPIPEGQSVVICPYCDLRALVQGERGVRRYQVPRRIDQAAAGQKLLQFLDSNWAIALNAKREAQLSELFLAYIPFWTMWARALGWVFGQEEVGSGKRRRRVARERRVAEDMTWNGAACDVAEFGVNRVPLTLTARELEAFDADELHAEGLVFEPVTSKSEAQAAAAEEFTRRVQKQSRLDHIWQTFTRFIHQRFGLVYYPLWALRYLYRGRAYQVVVDGHSGEVLYGRAPGNTWFRAAALIGGMALGAFVAVNGPLLLLYFMGNSSGDDGEGLLFFALVTFVIGVGLMLTGYNAFRYGEVYEFQKYAAEGPNALIAVSAKVKEWTRSSG